MYALIFVALIFVMCFCLFNYWFQKEKYRRMSNEEIKRLSSFNSPSAWIAYFIVSFFTTLALICYFVYKMYIEIFKMGP